ncbi:hypothetical protein B7494_g2064 [Chlorociboria aeruginascens]|nr:hypothetical protein B7494_g2064 [Chlorociboria aeruginascens]
MDTADSLDTSQIKTWRSIITLLVFIITNIIVLFPFHIPIYVPRRLWNALLDALSVLRVISPRNCSQLDDENGRDCSLKLFVQFNFPMDFMTAPLVADLFLLEISAIGRQEVHDGTIGADSISPIDIMAFFLTLAYIAISIDASGLIKYLAFKVLQKSGSVGHRLFFYLYALFFGLGSFIGNDPIILSGTAFLAYMTRVSSNIMHPRAWIHSQFAVANIASAILVSSNPTNLVLAGAFGIKFINYTANMIVPVFVAAIVLFPFLLYIVFADESLIPISIKMHELSEEAKAKKPVNPNIPHARGTAAEEENNLANGQQGELLSLEEIMNPFLDKGGATFGAVIMTTTLVTLLALNASSQSQGEHPVFWVTLPGAFVMFCWDVAFGWRNRHETRDIARKGRKDVEDAQAARAIREMEAMRAASEQGERDVISAHEDTLTRRPSLEAQKNGPGDGLTLILTPPLEPSGSTSAQRHGQLQNDQILTSSISTQEKKQKLNRADSPPETLGEISGRELNEKGRELDKERQAFSEEASQMVLLRPQHERPTLVSLVSNVYTWSQETFPTVTAVATHLPFALVPFAFSMFVLVQALVSKGWVQVFAYGWDKWVKSTGTVGSVGGMGFLSVVLCNFAGTNIGTTILLSRVIQHWQKIHDQNLLPISNRTFWGTVYSMALGVNFGAFGAAFSASLAGLLWRDILARKHIRVWSLDFARVNLPIITIAMAVGCSVLIGEIYIMRDDSPYNKHL